MTRIFLVDIPCTECEVEHADFIVHLSNTEREMDICDDFKLQGWCLNPECACRFRMTMTSDEFAVILQNSQPLKEGG